MRSSARISVILFLLVLTIGSSVTAQVSEREYADRRDRLAADVGPGAIIAFGAPVPVLTKFGFSQHPSFRYLTGFLEPDAVVVIENEGSEGQTTLFAPVLSIRTQLYDGFPEGRDALAIRTGMRVRDLAELPAFVDSLAMAGIPLNDIPDFGSNDAIRRDTVTIGQVFISNLRERHPGLEVGSAYPHVWAQRASKSESEIALLRRAIAITDSAHSAALATIRPGVQENEIQAVIDGTFRRLGAEGRGFGTIVGSGPNVTTIHYRAKERRMEAGDMVLMDIGAQFDGYVADVTRTLPVSGRFSTEQREIYELVLQAHKAAEALSVLGSTSAAAREAAVRVRLEGLAELGLIQHPDSTYDPMWTENCEARPTACSQGNFYMIHGISHGIGLEVHDAAAIGLSGRFAVGDVFTIEPGLYINAKAMDLLPDTPKNRAFVGAVRDVVRRYDRIGVRIEDDYLMTSDGPVRLSVGSLREPDDIEAAMMAAHGGTR